MGEKLGFLVDVSQQCVLCTGAQQPLELQQQKLCQRVEGGELSALLTPGGARGAAPLLGFPVQDMGVVEGGQQITT